MGELFLDVLKELVRGWRAGNPKLRIGIVIAAVLFTIAGILLAVSQLALSASPSFLRFWRTDIIESIAEVLGAIGAVISIVIYAVQKTKQSVQREKTIEAVELRAREHPKQPQLAWELARVKLESYLNRNLSQVRSIFFLTLLVMATGFILIGIGASEAFRDPDRFKASVLSSVSGIVVSFIGGTFLVLYKSTMAQAEDYVTILERINAVGMSVQILELLDDGDKDLKHQTMAAVARQLLHMYSHDMPEVNAPARARKARVGGR